MKRRGAGVPQDISRILYFSASILASRWGGCANLLGGNRCRTRSEPKLEGEA